MPLPIQLPPEPDRRVLAFDLGSTRTGWAHVAVLDGGVVYLGGGTLRFKRHAHEGRRWSEMAEALEAAIQQRTRPGETIAYEAVFGHRGTLAAQRYGGTVAVLTLHAYRAGCPVEGIHTSHVKARILGKGGGPGTGKAAMIKGVQALGLPVVDDNHADAVGVALQALAQGAAPTPE